MAFHRAIETLLREVTQTAILPRYRNLAAGEIEDKGGNDISLPLSSPQVLFLCFQVFFHGFS